jgi:hypothetical protein
MQTSNSTLSKTVTLLFVLFFLGGSVVNLIWPYQEFSASENRFLAKMPNFSWASLINGEFTSDFETFLTDQFPLREFWVSAKSDSERWMQKSENNGVYFAKDNSLIERFDYPDMEKSKQNLLFISEFIERTSLPVRVAWIPTAAEIQTEKLPNYASPYDQAEYVQTLLQDVASIESFIGSQLWKDLYDHATEQLYYNTDHHWTMLGAYRFYQTLMPLLGFNPLPEETFRREIISSDFFGTLDAKAGGGYAKADKIERWDYAEVSLEPSFEVSISDGNYVGNSFYFPERLQEKDKYTYYLDGNHALTIVRNSNIPQGKRLLLIKDSFSHALAPFLSYHYFEVHLLDLRYYNRSVDDYIAEQKIDEVLVLYSTRQFAVDNHLFKLAD